MNSCSISYRNEKDCKMSLKKVKLVEDGGYGYALDVTWTIETPERIQEFNIPRVWLPISNGLRISSDEDYYGGQRRTADIGFGDMAIGFNNHDPVFTIKTIEEKTKEMTLEEIEKKLGHKVKIISKEVEA